MRGSTENSVLVLAATRGDEQTLALAVSCGVGPQDLNARGASGVNALIAAARGSHARCVELLLSAGADPNELSVDGAGALLEACRQGSDDCARLLIGAGSRLQEGVDMAGRGSETPLMAALSAGAYGCAALLLEAGARLDEFDESGSTVLIRSCADGDSKAVEMLLAAGADPRAEASYPSCGTALYYAAQNGRVECARLLLAKLGSRELDSFDQAEYGESLAVACSSGFVECVGLIGSELVKVEGSAELFSDAFYYGAGTGGPAVLEALKACGASIDSATALGRTALMRAAMNGELDALVKLADAGADLSLACNRGYTALEWAQRRGQTDCQACLEALALKPRLAAACSPVVDSGSRRGAFPRL